MKKNSFLLAILFSVGIVQLAFAQTKPLTLSDIWEKPTFRSTFVAGFNFMNDGQHYAKQEADESRHLISKFNLETGKRVEVIFDGATFKQLAADATGSFDDYAFSADESKILIATDMEGIYRHSTASYYFIFDKNAKNGKITPLHEGKKQRLATFNPKGNKVAFIMDNNLFYKDLVSGKETQITTDGKQNEVINGAADWVYEEEFSKDLAFTWSPDGKRLAFLKFDESKVKEFSMQMYYNELYPSPYRFKYPKVGEANAVVTAHIYDLETAKTTAVETGNETDIYLPRLQWTQNPQLLCVTKINRLQNQLELLLADARTGSVKRLLEEKNQYYVDLHDNLTFLQDGKHFIWTSEADGFNHLYLYDMEGNLKKQITKGAFEVTTFYGMDEKNKILYYESTEVSPLERHIYAIKLENGKKQQISKETGTHEAQFNKDFSLFVRTYSAMGVPNQYFVCQNNGKVIRSIETNEKLAKKLEEYGIKSAEFLKIKNKEGEELNAFMMKPANFDPNKKYPVLMYVYGGPGSQTVRNIWGGTNYLWFNLLNQEGYIVVSVDNRGTGGRGEAFKKMTYLQLGKYETEDQVAAANYLQSLAFVDGSRIGIFGWSYGGYMSSLCILKGNEVFKAAIAVAPVTNWKWYDSIYTERFMRTPKENENGYELNSPIHYADRLKGAYLLVHGLADDNVHFQNTAEMANALVEANKSFETQLYTNHNHSISGNGARIHLFTKITNFIKDNL